MPETRERIETIAGSPDKLDWDYVYQLARRHSILPLIYSQLSTAAENIPPDQLARFKKQLPGECGAQSLVDRRIVPHSSEFRSGWD